MMIVWWWWLSTCIASALRTANLLRYIVKRNVFSADRKDPMLSDGSRRWSGSRFQTIEPATENARRPNLLRRWRGTISWWRVLWTAYRTFSITCRRFPGFYTGDALYCSVPRWRHKGVKNSPKVATQQCPSESQTSTSRSQSNHARSLPCATGNLRLTMLLVRLFCNVNPHSSLQPTSIHSMAVKVIAYAGFRLGCTFLSPQVFTSK